MLWRVLTSISEQSENQRFQNWFSHTPFVLNSKVFLRVEHLLTDLYMKTVTIKSLIILTVFCLLYQHRKKNWSASLIETYNVYTYLCILRLQYTKLKTKLRNLVKYKIGLYKRNSYTSTSTCWFPQNILRCLSSCLERQYNYLSTSPTSTRKR